MLKKSFFKINPTSRLSFSLERGKKETLSVTLAQDQSSHVMWDLLFVGLEIRGGSSKAGQEITGQGKVRSSLEPFLLGCPRNGSAVLEVWGVPGTEGREDEL